MTGSLDDYRVFASRTWERRPSKELTWHELLSVWLLVGSRVLFVCAILALPLTVAQPSVLSSVRAIAALQSAVAQSAANPLVCAGSAL